MDLSAPIYELKRQAKQLRRESNLTHTQALDQIAKGEGYSSWSILIRKLEEQKPKPVALKQGYQITSLPVDAAHRKDAIEVANHSFEHVFNRIEPDNPTATRELWNVEAYVDDNLSEDMLPIDSEYALSLLESSMLFHVVNLATEADRKVLADN